jgi:hypothetical protein
MRERRPTFTAKNVPLEKADKLRAQAVAPRCVKGPRIVRGLSSEKVVVQASIPNSHHHWPPTMLTSDAQQLNNP